MPLRAAADRVAKVVNVSVKGDTSWEPDETFDVHLSAATNATIADADGTGAIANDDAVPSLTVEDVSAQEGDSTSTPFGFVLALSNPSSLSITVTVSTVAGSAASPADCVAKTVTVTFSPGQTRKTVNVAVRGDTAVEPDETFALQVTAANDVDVVDGQGVGTIVNDD